MDFETHLPNGVFTATLTPLNKDLSVDYQMLVDHCHWLFANGSNGVALLGTTGEANSFALRERFEMIDLTIKGGISPDRLMVGTGCCSFKDTIALTQHAVNVGIEGILMLPPFFYKQVSDDGLMKYFDQVINGVRSTGLKIYLYHFPKMSGINFSTPLVHRLVQEFPGVIVGMKDSSGDWEHMKEVLAAIPGFKLYAGTEKYLLDILKIGGVGCISATANATTSLAGKVFQTWKANGDAESLNEHLIAVRTAFEGLPFSGALKFLLSKWRGQENWLNIRPPNTIINSKEWEELEARLKTLDFNMELIYN